MEDLLREKHDLALSPGELQTLNRSEG